MLLHFYRFSVIVWGKPRITIFHLTSRKLATASASKVLSLWEVAILSTQPILEFSHCWLQRRQQIRSFAETATQRSKHRLRFADQLFTVYVPISCSLYNQLFITPVAAPSWLLNPLPRSQFFESRPLTPCHRFIKIIFVILELALTV